MATQKGRGVRVEISKTEGTPVTITSVTSDDPAIAGYTGAAMADGLVGYFTDVTGMSQLDGQAVRIDAPAINAFTLQGFDADDMPAFTAGKFIPITAWSTLSKSTDIEIGGGESDKTEETVLLDTIKKESAGLLAAETATIQQRTDQLEEAVTLIRKSSRKNGYHVFRITFADGEQWIWRGQPSVPGANIALGQLATGSISVTVKGIVLYLPPIAA